MNELGLETKSLELGISTFFETLKKVEFEHDPWPEEMLALLKENRQSLLAAFT
jgi:hypothetical protein